MGASCAVSYAFLYLRLLEMVDLMQDFQPWLLWYDHFIDDAFGLVYGILIELDQLELELIS